MDTETISVRRALPQDYPAILALGVQYWGHDYVPGEYHALLRNPDIKAFVIVKDRHVIGFQFYQAVNGGRTLVRQGARLSPTVRGRGIYSVAKALWQSVIPKEFPRAVGYEGTTIQWDVHADKRDNTLLLQKQVVIFHIDPPVAKALLSDRFKRSRAGDVANLSPQELRKVLSNRQNQQRLFPQGRIVCDWKPFSFVTEDLATVSQMVSQVTVTRDLASPYKPVALSLLRTFEGPEYREMRIDFYGSECSYEEVFVHMLRHLPLAERCHVIQPVSFILFVPLSMDKSRVIDIARDISVPGKPIRSPTMTLMGTSILSHL